MDSQNQKFEYSDMAEAISRLFTKIIGAKIREVREKGQFGSIKNFAKDINVGITTLSELEKGYNFPKLETVLYICLCLGIDVSDIADMLRNARNRFVHMDAPEHKEVIHIKPLSQLKEEIANTYNHVNKELLHLDTILTANLNSTGIEMVKEYVNFIASQPKYQSRSAYSKKKEVKDEPKHP